MVRHLLEVHNVSAAEIRGIFRLAKRCKQTRGFGRRVLEGAMVALVFQKPSMRTRVAFEVAVNQLGGSSIYLGPGDIQLGEREPVKDVARVLSRYVEAIVTRTFGHEDAELFARYATVPVINGLSDRVHPCQALADLFTIHERFGTLRGLTIGYLGDGNNVLHALAQGASLLGVNLIVATPDGYRPNRAIWTQASRQAARAGSALRWTSDPEAIVRRADVLYTDVWTSMGQERERLRRRRVFRPFQLNRRLLARTKRDCVVMHCLPAHRGEEITEEVLEGSRSIVFDQAENRLYVQKALLIFLLKQKR